MNTREEIILLSDDIIRRKGYSAFSYGDLSAILNIAKPAIHHHFRFKSDLGLALLDREIRIMSVARYKWLKNGQKGAVQLGELINIFRQRSHLDQLCMTGALAIEFNGFNPEMQQKCREMCEAIVDMIDTILQTGLDDKTLRFEGPSKDRATIVASLLAAALQLARIMGPQTFAIIIDRMLADLGTDMRLADIKN